MHPISIQAALYDHNTSIDLYLGRLREALKSIPSSAITLPHGCFPVLTDVIAPGAHNRELSFLVACGYHFSDFEKSRHERGIWLQPPVGICGLDMELYVGPDDGNIVIPRTALYTPTVGMHITRKMVDLDQGKYCEVGDGREYKKWVAPKPSKECPF